MQSECAKLDREKTDLRIPCPIVVFVGTQKITGTRLSQRPTNVFPPVPFPFPFDKTRPQREDIKKVMQTTNALETVLMWMNGTTVLRVRAYGVILTASIAWHQRHVKGLRGDQAMQMQTY